jgi:peptide/nickel transport system substrate-binding protein
MNKRWFILLAVVMTLSLVLVACQGQVQEAVQEAAPTIEAAVEEVAPTVEAAVEEAMGEGSIWVLLPDSASSPRWETDDRRYFAEAFEAAGIDYEIVNAEGDARVQQTQAEQAITAGAKVILLVNLDSGSGSTIIAQAREAGVSVIDYDRLTIEGPGADVYVSFDNVAVGRTMGEVLEPLINAQEGTPQVVQLNGAPTDNNATLFREGYFSVAEPHYNDGSWELVADQAVPDWDGQEALVLFEQILTAAENNVTAVFAANDNLANSVISALKSAGIDPGDAGIPISGQDATVGGIQHIMAGDQAMSVYKPIKAEAEAAAEAAIALFNGEDVAALAGGTTINNGTNDIPFIALTPVGVVKENIADTVIADGFRTWEELCVGEFEAFCAEVQEGGMAEEPAEEAAPAMAYAEAPMLADMVAAGDLPPVEERLPAEPLVEEVVDEIGQYGGTLRRGFTGPSDHNNYTRVVYDALVRHAPDGTEVIPHIARGWESNEDFTVWQVFLREGMKWSDGEPFTADDILFWYENILLNEELTPAVPVWMQNADGSTALVEKIDDTTVQWTFAQPNTAFLLDLANKDGADAAISNLAFVPAHYMEQFHADFADEAELQAKLDEAGFETWVELFAQEALPQLSGTRPSTAAWAPNGTSVSDEVFTIVRNPYYFAVDPEGNQLPYIDEVQFTLFLDKETLNLAAVAGEIDMQGRHINMSSYPVLKENEAAGGYRVITWPTFGGSDAVIMFNQNWIANDPVMGELFQNRDFRIALSHAIDRNAILESAFFGLGEPRQGVPAPFHPYYPGDEYAFKYTEYDVDLANQMLDDIGLTERDADGFRLLPNGEPLDIEIGAAPVFANWPDIAQLIAEDWADVGIRAHVEVRERALHFQMRDTNDLMTEIWNDDTTGFPFSGQPKQDVRSQPALAFGPLYRQWYLTDGAEGLEPPDDIKRLVEIIDEAKVSDRDRQIELAQELFRLWADNIYEIGTVGLTPMVQGVVVANENLMNIPEVAGNDWPLRTPGDTRPEQYFYKQ